jgi:tetratricopeptide (TPR) repeat protein
MGANERGGDECEARTSELADEVSESEEGSDEEVDVDVYYHIDPAQGHTAEMAAALQREYLECLQMDSRAGMFNAVHQMLTAGLYRECIQAYLNLARRYPGEAGGCYGNIGAAYYFLGEFELAISYYELAREHGADEGMMNENIHEARRALEAS